MSVTLRIIVTAVFFAFVFLTGIWLTRSGRPLHAGLSAAHKLISLVAGVLLLVTLFQRHQLVPLSGIEWSAIVVTGLCFVGTVASGGILSSDEPRPTFVLRLHQAFPVLTLLSSVGMLHLVLGA
jgi:hypothetical protein